jgi:hypothetical protein
VEDVVNCCVKTTVVMYALVGPTHDREEINGWQPAVAYVVSSAGRRPAIVVELKESWQFDKNYT